MSSKTKPRFKIIPAVYLILRNDSGEVLFMRRSNTGYMDGFFGLPSGHLEGCESLKQATIRECWEEIGIKILENDLNLLHIAHRYDKQDERMDFFFETKKYSGTFFNKEPHKCSEIKWLNIGDNEIIDYIKTVLYKIENLENYSDFDFENK
jgi:8-oxo-dGTP diphosphatase